MTASCSLHRIWPCQEIPLYGVCFAKRSWLGGSSKTSFRADFQCFKFMLSMIANTYHFTSRKHGLLATVAYHFGRGRKPTYALEGSIAVAGSGVKFLMNNLGFISSSHKISDLAATVDNSGGCVFVTAFSGLFAPYWIDDAKGT